MLAEYWYHKENKPKDRLGTGTGELVMLSLIYWETSESRHYKFDAER